MDMDEVDEGYTKFDIRTFTFEYHDTSVEKSQCIELRTPEVWDTLYGMYTWPAAPVLAQYIWYHRDLINGKQLLEIGAGTALAGILAAKCGAVVTLSDGGHLPHCLANCRRSCALNDVDYLRVLPLTWGQFTRELIDLPPLDYVIASDCFYRKRDFDDIMLTVTYFLKKSRACEFWCSYQERSADKSLEFYLLKYGLSCRHVALASFGADRHDLAGSDLPGSHTIHLLVIKLRS